LATERASHAQSQAHLATVEQHWQARLEAAEAAGREAEQSARQDADDIAELREAQQSHDALGQDAQAQERAATAAAVAKLERALELVEELRGSLEELSAKNARLEEAGLERQRQRSLEDREAVDSERRRDEHMQRVAAEALQPVAELHAELDSLRRERDELTLACSSAMRREREALAQGLVSLAAQPQPQPQPAAAAEAVQPVPPAAPPALAGAEVEPPAAQPAAAAGAEAARLGAEAARLASLEAELKQSRAAEAAGVAAVSTAMAHQADLRAEVRALEAKLRRVGAQLAAFTQAMGAADMYRPGSTAMPLYMS